MLNAKSDTNVLIVDDDKLIITILQQALASEGWQTFAAMDGEEAIRMFGKVSPDLVILDLILPKVDGADVCRSIRQQSQIPILILSARLEQETKIECLDTGADDYMTKPFDIDELLARVRALLRRTKPISPVIIQLNFVCGGLKIDFAARRVTVSGKEVSLTPKEYELLKELALNNGKILKYDELLTRVWGPDCMETAHHLHAHIYTLRRKIENDPQNSYCIVNVNRVGFRLDVKR